MKHRILRLAFIAAVALAIPTAVALASGPNDHAKGHEKASTHATHPGTGKPDTAGKSESAGERPHNHGWFVSQVAKNGNTGKAHGEEVSAVARGSDGKP